MQQKIITHSAQATKDIAYSLAASLTSGEVLALTGELGSGKTTFVQGLAEYFGCAKQISSPTFTLVQEYAIKQKKTKQLKRNTKKAPLQYLIHLDCYRLNSIQEIINLGLTDYLNQQDAILIIEWAEKIKSLLPPHTYWLSLRHGRQPNERIISIQKSNNLQFRRKSKVQSKRSRRSSKTSAN